MTHWLATYLLHPLHGGGYQWWSGAGSDLGYLGIITTLLLKHNCYRHRCPRIGRVLGPDGHHRCKRHHRLAA